MRVASFRPDIQGLRAVAVILVMLDHAGWLPAGFFGVDIFFVISGFVISGLLLREVQEHGEIRYGQFYVRRVFRLLPAATLVSLVSLVLALLLLSPFGQQQQAGGTGAAASLWLANLPLWLFTGGYFDQNVSWNPFLHYWSLSVEEQFYLVFPLLIGGVAWAIHATFKGQRSPAPWIAGVIGAVTVLSFGAMCYLSYVQPSSVLRPLSLSFYSAPTRAWEFGIGVLLSLYLQKNRKLDARIADALCLAGVLVLVVAMFVISPTVTWPGLSTLLPVLGVGLLIAGGRDARWGSRLLSTPPAVRIGDASYSLYLWHWPLIVAASKISDGSAVATSLALALTFPIALWSYDHVEQRFRGTHSEWSKQALTKVAIAVVLPVFLGMIVFLGSQRYWGLSQFRALGSDVVPNAQAFQACLDESLVSARQGRDCLFNEDAGSPVYLVGDSNAMMYSDPLILATRETGHSLQVATRAGCGLFAAGDLPKGCGAWSRDARDWLSQQQPGIVYVGWAGEPRHYSTGEWETEARASVAQLVSAGHRVVMIQAIPHPTGSLHEWWDAADCPNLSVLSDPASCSTSVDLVTENARQSAALEIIESTASAGAEVLDFREQLCPRGVCSTRAANFWQYRDGMHLSVAGSLSLVPAFEASLDGVTPARR